MIYIIGSLKNPNIPVVASALRADGHHVFDEWYACGPDADRHWREHHQQAGRDFKSAMWSDFTNHSFEFDRQHMMMSDTGILVLPAGKSGHMELGWMIGKGKRGIIYMEQEPEAWDLMYRFAELVIGPVEDLLRVF
jgi:hypothetical protein